MSTATRHRSAWTAAAAAAAVAGVVLFVSGLLVLGVNSERGSDGYISGDAKTYQTPTYALSTTGVRLDGLAHGHVPSGVLGRVRVRVQSDRPAFVGIAPAGDVERYLTGVAHQDVDALEGKLRDAHAGGFPSGRSVAWVASASGERSETVEWKPRSGNWRVVVMNKDGRPNVTARVSVGAQVPHLERDGILILAAGLAAMATAAGVLYRVHRRSAD
jgi:hypothetical protein